MCNRLRFTGLAGDCLAKAVIMASAHLAVKWPSLKSLGGKRHIILRFSSNLPLPLCISPLENARSS